MLTQKQFNSDLCALMVSLNIPIKKVNDVKFKEFFNKYTNFRTPSDTTLKTECLRESYDKTISGIKGELKDEYIWVSVDETRDTLKKECF